MSEQAEPTISIVITTLGAPSRLRRSLPAAVRALEARGVDGDEVVVVDDSGAERASGVVAELLGTEDLDAESLDTERSETGAGETDADDAEDAPRPPRLVRVLETESNLGAGAATLLGARRAAGELALLMHDDVSLRVGALERLAAAFERDSVFAAGPSLVLEGDPEDGRARREVRLVDDRLEVQPADSAPSDPDAAPRPVTYLPAACLMVRRERFVAEGGYDPLLAPFTWEDVDLGLSARRRGERVVRVEDAVAEVSRDLPSALDGLPKGLVEAVGERNRLLTRWKHLSTRAEASEHLVGLWRSVMEAGLAGDRDRLEAICLAFEELPAVTASRQAMSGAMRTLDDVV